LELIISRFDAAQRADFYIVIVLTAIDGVHRPDLGALISASDTITKRYYCPVSNDVVRLLEEAIGKKAPCELLPMHLGDVPETYADVDGLIRDFGFKPAPTSKLGSRPRQIHSNRRLHYVANECRASVR
jgi:hypothetical protein